MTILFNALYIVFGTIVIISAVSLAIPLSPLFSAAGGLIIGQAIGTLIGQYA